VFDGGATSFTGSVAEREASGTVITISSAIGATDPEGTAITYTLTGEKFITMILFF
jgi:hypothetical protein